MHGGGKLPRHWPPLLPSPCYTEGVEPEGAATRVRLIPFGRWAGHLATRPVWVRLPLLLGPV